MMKNILSLAALALMASASRLAIQSYTLADLESMEETDTPIRIDIDKYFDSNAIYLRLDEDEPEWTA